jgi:serine/threonine protein kinase
MHRDVKPHNVMIDHEKRKVGIYLFIYLPCRALLIRSSCA